MDASLDAQKYGDYLDQLLLELRNQIDAQGRAVLGPGADRDDLENHVLELNSFYYQSFAQRFLPQFRQLMNDDMRNLCQIHQQETTLKQTVMTGIHQQARLFNQVKNITSLIKAERPAVQALGLSDQPGRAVRSVDLLYIWKDFAQNWNSFLAELRKLQNFLSDQKMLSALKHYPAHAAVSALLYTWKSPDARAGRDLNHLLAAWQLALKMLAKFQEDLSPAKDSGRLLISELEKTDASWDNRKNPALLRTWYQQYIQKTFRLYLDTLRLGGDKNDRQLTVQAAAQLHDWLQALLYVMENGSRYRDQGSPDFISRSYLLAGLDPDQLHEMAVYSARMLQTAEESIQGLAASAHASYSNYSRQCSQIVDDGIRYLQQKLDDKVNANQFFLAPALEQLKNQLNLLANRLEHLDEKEEYAGQLNGQCLALTESLDSCLELLQSIQEEIVRGLNPRNLKRSFTGMDLHLEHLTMAVGAPFPSTHRHLLAEGLIKIQSAPGTEGRILSAEGDIFIIRLDELVEREIPAITIAGKD